MGFVFNATLDDGLPHDMGPDVGFDRPGNDIDCFGVAGSNATASFCAAECGNDERCQAYTFIASGPPIERVPCNRDKGALVPPYCTLKSPVPAKMSSM